ncbi:MAG: chemotaxis protein CheD [Dehalococcoidia bacterium]|nr:chemotaxis protein CheD [Dehalococcoidia bacterium]
MREHETTLSLGEWAVSADPTSVLACLGLGSCVAFIVHDAARHVAGMAHTVLPDSALGRPPDLVGARYVDVAVPLVLERVAALGARLADLQVHLVGGSSMLSSQADRLRIGERNVEAARLACVRHGLTVTSQDVGGTTGRTVRLHVGTGQLTLRGAGGPALNRLAA